MSLALNIAAWPTIFPPFTPTLTSASVFFCFFAEI
jgi:hypothetical protein